MQLQAQVCFWFLISFTFGFSLSLSLSLSLSCLFGSVDDPHSGRAMELSHGVPLGDWHSLSSNTRGSKFLAPSGNATEQFMGQTACTELGELWPRVGVFCIVHHHTAGRTLLPRLPQKIHWQYGPDGEIEHLWKGYKCNSQSYSHVRERKHSTFPSFRRNTSVRATTVISATWWLSELEY